MKRTFCFVTIGALTVATSLLVPDLVLSQSDTDEQPLVIERVPEPSPLLIEPERLDELFDRSLQMVELYRLDLARQYLDQFAKNLPSDTELLEIQKSRGTSDFVKLSQVDELKSVAVPLLQRLSKVSRRQSQSQEHIDQILNRVSSSSVNERDIAIMELRNIGEDAIPRILWQLSQPENHDKRDLYVVTMSQMGRQSIPPLLGGLESPHDHIRAAVIDVFGRMRSSDTIPYLVSAAVSEKELPEIREAAVRSIDRIYEVLKQKSPQLTADKAALMLKQEAKRTFEKKKELPWVREGLVEIWKWSSDQDTVTSKTYSEAAAELLVSNEFANQSLMLVPNQPDASRLALASELGFERLQSGWEKPLPETPTSVVGRAIEMGEETNTDVLSDSLSAGQAASAIAAIQVLSKIGTREFQLEGNRSRSALIKALNYPDPRVQFAAARSIVELNPQSHFRDASRVVEILARSLYDVRKSAVVIDA
ncbi:MAG: HEAT repeat domain-containing protein, partial [Planctomycetes bacterium]|nr:HEAT repeat domain-containing protein [Planctomycetota bacterium]